MVKRVIKFCLILVSFLLTVSLESSSMCYPSDAIKGLQKDNPYYIYIDLDDYKLFLFKNGVLFKEYRCSGGKRETPSPLGTWTIISKDSWSGGFGPRWMGLNVPWGSYGIHGTNYSHSIGSGASHGCIRMRNEDVKDLYGYVPHGTKVEIVKGPYGNFGDGLRILRAGDRGADVYQVQKTLYKFGYYYGYSDGVFGEGLKNAVIKFRKDKGLSVGDSVDRQMYKVMGIILMD